MQIYVRNADYAIYVTEVFLQRRYPASHNAITTNASNVELPNFDDDVLKKHISLLNSSNKVLRLGMIGNLDVAYKGFDITLKALSLIKDKLGAFKLILVGGGNPALVKRQAEELGLEDHIMFAGKLKPGKEIFAFLDTLSIYLHPSKQEGLPRSLIEAMGRACPALGSTTAGIPELLPNEYLHKTGDYKKLANQILKLANSKEEAKYAARINFFKAKEYTIDLLKKKRDRFFENFIQGLNN